MDTFAPVKTHLFTPGPTTLPQAVIAAMAGPIMHHRTPEWQACFTRVLDRLPALFGTSGSVAMFTTSGSGAMECAIANLVNAGDEICVVSFGRFGARWAAIAERYGAVVHHLEMPLGQRPDPEAAAEFVAKYPHAVACFTTHSETATGAVSDAGALAAAIRKSCGDDLLLVMDAISSLGAVEVCMDTWGYDVVVTGSQKALMVPPGLSFVAVSDRARARGLQVTSPRFYLDWEKALNAHAKSPASTPFTPALTIVLGLDAALDLLDEEGMSAVYLRHVRHGHAMRAAMQALGLKLFSPDDPSSAILTAVWVPNSIDGGALPALLRSWGVTIAGGQDDLKGEIFRVGHCGHVNDFDILVAVGAVERGLAELGHSFDHGAGVATAQQTLLSPVSHAVA